MTQTSIDTSSGNNTKASGEQTNLISSNSSEDTEVGSQLALSATQDSESKAIASPDPVRVLTTPSASAADRLIEVSVETEWWKRLSWKNQVTIGAIAIVLIPALIIGGSSYYFENRVVAVIIGSSISVIVASAIAIFLTNRFLRPISIAATTVKQLGQGKLDTRIQFSGNDELSLLGNNINQLAEKLQSLLAEKEATQRRDRLLNDIVWRTRQATDSQELTHRILNGIRRTLNLDRVIIYRFNPDWSGTVVAESVGIGWTKTVDETIDDPCFRGRYIPQYQNGRVRAIDDIYNEPGLTDCYIRTLEQFDVKANLVAPMRKNNQLVGLLIAHQCSSPRNWQQSEIDFFLQLASQIEYALDHVGFIEQLQTSAKRERLLSDIAGKARQTTDSKEVINSALSSVRKILEVERVIIYRFNPDWSGTVVAESVASGWTRALDEKIDDPCFRARYIPQYQNGRVRAINDIQNEPGLTDCHIRTLEQFEVKANLVAPMKKDGELVGLLIAHQCSKTRNWQQSEIDFFLQLASQIEYALDRVSFIEQLQSAARRERLLGDIALKARQVTDREEILNSVLAGVRKVLEVERVIIYRFNPDWSGTIVAESVASGWTRALQEKIDDPCFRARYIPQYQNGRVRAINDLYNEPGLTDCHIRTLEQFEVKANLVAPMKKDEQLVGLLIAHQCSKTRNWQQSEIDFFLQLASQIEYAIDHVGFIKQLEDARQSAEKISLEQRQEKEELQSQLELFLEQIESSFEGDLTVRASVTAGEMGTVADFFNALIENLEQIVLQVQSAANAVTQTAKVSEIDVNTLSDEAKRQSEAIAATLTQIQVMANSIQKVATSAQQAAQKVQEANQTLLAGDKAMNKTVYGILAIEQTFEETTLKVKRLGESSQKISRASSLIKDLANQTNILALNASIESAGGGQEGKGFAIVAEEVRSIAEQSAAATKEIEQIVEEIQIETNEVVVAMEAGMQQVSTGTNLVKTARAKLNSIAAVSAQIRTLVQQMAQAATSQMKTSSDLTETMQEIATIANQTSAQSQVVAESFTKLLGVADELQESVSQFKVK